MKIFLYIAILLIGLGAFSTLGYTGIQNAISPYVPINEGYTKITGLYTNKISDWGTCVWYKESIDDGDYIIISDYYINDTEWWQYRNYVHKTKPFRVLKTSYVTGQQNYQYLD